MWGNNEDCTLVLFKDALGHHTIGTSMVDFVLYGTRELADNCAGFQSLSVCTVDGLTSI